MAPEKRILGFPRNVFAIGLTSLLNDAASEMIYPLLPVFLTTTLGAGAAFLGLIEGTAESIASLGKLVSGWVSDRFGNRKGLMLLGYGLATRGAAPDRGLAGRLAGPPDPREPTGSARASAARRAMPSSRTRARRTSGARRSASIAPWITRGRSSGRCWPRACSCC